MDILVEFCFQWWQVTAVVCALFGVALALWLIQRDGQKWVDDLKDVKKPSVGSVSVRGFVVMFLFLIPPSIMYALATWGV